MARNTGPVCKICRREGEKLFLKGERCFTPKCAIERRAYPPGQHGRQAQYRRRVSDYSRQLRGKQRARRIYGVMERQFRRYYAEAAKEKGVTGLALLRIMERRLDNVVYRLRLGSSRAQARQLVRHGHIEVNGRKVDIPSYQVDIGDTIDVREKSRKNGHFDTVSQTLGDRPLVGWLSFDETNLVGRVVTFPEREEIEPLIDEAMIVEYYSR
ncbi:MAG: 30S ribosomal protein S4 [Anaerolineae bacterium]